MWRLPIFTWNILVTSVRVLIAFPVLTFLFGGLAGVMEAAPSIDFHVTDSYFVVAHFHYLLFGTSVFATYSGIYFWFPKMTGCFLDGPLGRLHFWLTFVGFQTTFLIQHWLGNIGMRAGTRITCPLTGSPR